PWTRVGGPAEPGPVAGGPRLELDWTERGVVVCGDGTADPAAATALAALAGWPLLAEPSSGARHGPAALGAYEDLLDCAEFSPGHRPAVVVSAGGAGLTRGQLALLRGLSSGSGDGRRHVVLAQGPGRWSDPARSATDVAGQVGLRGAPAGPVTGWL